MGYSPSDIGLSYVPQTLAFLLGGYGCRAALKRINGKTLLPWLLVTYGVSMVALYLVATLTAPTLTTLLIRSASWRWSTAPVTRSWWRTR